MRDGRRLKAETGGYAGFGSPAYGQRAVKGELVPDADEQAALQRIRELHRQGRSLREIATALTDEGFKPKRADRWHPESLRRIVGRL